MKHAVPLTWYDSFLPSACQNAKTTSERAKSERKRYSKLLQLVVSSSKTDDDETLGTTQLVYLISPTVGEESFGIPRAGPQICSDGEMTSDW